MTRRAILETLAATPFAASAAPSAARPALCIFSKHMARFGYDELGKKAKEIGFDGVDLTVRPKGHVEPGRAAQDLPKAYEAIRAHGLSVPMITTGLLRADEPDARPAISTAAKLQIPFWKNGYYRYKSGAGAVESGFASVKQSLAGLAAMSKEYGIACGVHNHSGEQFGSPVWDIREAIAPLDPQAIGYYFDPAHATIEGGLGGWKISLNLVAPRLKMVALKDFYWAKSGDGRWKVQWCPMGEGMVDWAKVFAGFRSAGFAGPLTLHVEYEPKDELAAIAKDFEFARKQLAAAWSG